ncbi:MAG: DUF6266 family protein [Fermentimonas sp.]|nr:DUF6266 family protein [Fermentimonas sp.]
MGKLKEGILGGFSGKVGNVVGSSCRGVEYIKSRPSKMTNPRTKGQTKQRTNFIITQNFLRTFTPFVRVGFKDHAVDGRSAFNAAMSYNMSNAIKADGDDMELDFPNVLVSKGTLFPAKDINAKVVEGEVLFQWKPETEENEKPDDQAMVLVYNYTKTVAVYDFNAGKRGGLSTRILLPENWSGDFIETYIAFKSADGSVVSDSVYSGRFVV